MTTQTHIPQDAARPMRADARRNRAAILEAARELFASERPDVQIDDVARRAGVGVGTVYRHFPDKEALMGELVRARFDIFNERLRDAIAAGEQPGADAFTILADALADNAGSVAADAATRFAFMSGGERVFAHADAEKAEFVELCAVLVQRAHASGQLRPDFHAEDVPMVMCGMCATMGKQAAGWDWRHHLDLILSGMHAEPRGETRSPRGARTPRPARAART
jgi:AcrR family transcriptional regulator